MKLVWHIARKDLRRMALPTVLWIAFIMGTAIWFRFASPASRGQPNPEIISWLAVLEIWTKLIGIGQFVIGYLLAGALVIEDALVGPDNFWMTRPIANGRLLVAKIIAAAVLFIAAPAVAVATIWIASGFTVTETLVAMGEMGFWQGIVTLPALMVASLSRNLVQFLFCSAGLLVGYQLCAILVVVGASFIHVSTFRPTPFFVRVQLAPLMMLGTIALTQQFLRRRRAQTWLTIGIALPACIAVSVARPWDIHRGVSVNPWPGQRGAPSDATMTVEDLSLRIYPHPARRNLNDRIQANLTLAMSPGAAPDGTYYAPSAGTATVVGSGRSEAYVPFGRGGGWGHDVALSLVLGTSQPTMKWNLYGMALGSTSTSKVRVDGEVDVWRTRPVAVGEMPMRVGAEISRHGCRTRVVAVEPSMGWECALILEEHDSHLAALDGLEFDSATDLSSSERRWDLFVLVNRDAHRAEIIDVRDFGSTVMNGQITGFRRLLIPSATGDGAWRREATIVKVRFERDSHFIRTFEMVAPVISER